MPVILLISLAAHIMWVIFMVVTTYWAGKYFGSFAYGFMVMSLIISIPLLLWTLVFFLMSVGNEDLFPTALLLKSIVMFFFCYMLTFGELSCADDMRKSYRLGMAIKSDPVLLESLLLGKNPTPADAAHVLSVMAETGTWNESYVDHWKAVDKYLETHNDLNEPWLAEQIAYIKEQYRTEKENKEIEAFELEYKRSRNSFYLNEADERRLHEEEYKRWPKRFRDPKTIYDSKTPTTVFPEADKGQKKSIVIPESAIGIPGQDR